MPANQFRAKLQTMFNFLKKKTKEPENLEEALNYLRVLENKLEGLSKEFEILKKESVFSLQKIGVLRYNPFSEVGSNQSFSVALLNGGGDGLIITSLYSREGNRVYGKPIKKGESEYSLSNEERATIKLAQNNNGDKNEGKFDNSAAPGGGNGSC